MKKATYLDNRHLALRIMGKEGFAGVKAEVGKRMDAVRASKIVNLLRREYGISELDPELLALAASKRKGHTGGPVKPPAEGEEREYTVGQNFRIGVPLNILGKKPGDKAQVRYSRRQIVIRS